MGIVRKFLTSDTEPVNLIMSAGTQELRKTYAPKPTNESVTLVQPNSSRIVTARQLRAQPSAPYLARQTSSATNPVTNSHRRDAMHYLMFYDFAPDYLDRRTPHRNEHLQKTIGDRPRFSDETQHASAVWMLTSQFHFGRFSG